MSAGGGFGHALVVGCAGKQLPGVAHDVRAMAEMLRARDFAVDVCTGTAATREGILAGYDQLIASARPDQAAVVYYTGHGFYAYREAEGRPWQGLCPSDMDAGSTEDFRGITAWELSIKQAQLTRRTKNVTVIFDCCHASQMSREGAVAGGVARVLPHPVRVGFAAHLDALRARYGCDFDAIESSGDRDAVRLVACGQGETAFEYEASPGEYRGAFTEALLRVLHDLGDARVSWAAIESAIRARVFDRFPSQRPSMDGPVRRIVFSLDEDEYPHRPTIVAIPSGFHLFAGRLMGVSQGDVYGVMPSGCRTYDDSTAVAEVQVREAFATSAFATLRRWSNGHTQLCNASLAVPLERQIVKWPVRVVASQDAQERVASAFAATGVLRVAYPEEPALATLTVTRHAVTIEDRIGLLGAPSGFPDDLERLVRALAELGAARRVRELEGEHGVSASEVDVEWGVVEAGHMQRKPDRGCMLGLRARVYVKVASRAQRPLFAHVFNIDPRGTVKLLTQNLAAAGVPLHQERSELVLGRSDHGTPEGLTLEWPGDLPREHPRIEELVVIVTAMPASLRWPEHQEQLGARHGPDPSMTMLDGFLVRRLSWVLVPQDVAMAEGAFAAISPSFPVA